MDFKQHKKIPLNEHNYHIENLHIARDFSKKIIEEFQDLIKAIVLFGSNAHDTTNKDSDIDIILVLDNVSVYVTEEMREAYKIITQQTIALTSQKIHLTTMNFSDLWDMARKADPVLVNILRHGVPIFDRNIVEPLQYLLEIGKIKPSRETIYNYLSRSQTLLEQVDDHYTTCILDLYYALVDGAHAVILTHNHTPTSPKEMPILFNKLFKNKPLAKNSKLIAELYDLVKKIEHKTLSKKISTSQIDGYSKRVTEAITQFSKHIEEELKKKDTLEL